MNCKSQLINVVIYENRTNSITYIILHLFFKLTFHIDNTSQIGETKIPEIHDMFSHNDKDSLSTQMPPLATLKPHISETIGKF